MIQKQMKYIIIIICLFADMLKGHEEIEYNYVSIPAKYYNYGEVLEWQMQGAHLDLSHVELDQGGRNMLAQCSWLRGVRISGGLDNIDEFLSFVLSAPNLEVLEVKNAELCPEIFLLLPWVNTLKVIRFENVGIKKEDTKKWDVLSRLASQYKALTLLGCDGVPDSFLLKLAEIYEFQSGPQVEIGTVDHGKTDAEAKAFLRGNNCLKVHCREGLFDVSPRSVTVP